MRKKYTKLEQKNTDLENRIDQEAELRANRKLSEHEEKSESEKARITEEYEHKLKMKDKEIEASKLQSAEYTDEKIREALKRKEENYRLKEMEFRLQISRIEKENEKMQKTLENVPPEFRGTAGEMKLFDDLHTAFHQDDLVAKKVGVEMPDVIQTIITQSGERIRTHIVWDMKRSHIFTIEDHLRKPRTLYGERCAIEKYNASLREITRR